MQTFDNGCTIPRSDPARTPSVNALVIPINIALPIINHHAKFDHSTSNKNLTHLRPLPWTGRSDQVLITRSESNLMQIIPEFLLDFVQPAYFFQRLLQVRPGTNRSTAEEKKLRG